MFGKFRSKTTAVVGALAIVAFAVATPTVSAQGRNPSNLTIPVVGTIPTGGVFSGALTVTSFAVENGQVIARGLLTGLLTDATGATTSVISTFATPVDVTQASCQILHLDLGPLNLNLLGLVVDLSEVVLDITAQPGPGNLLGNLLCAVTGLLDNLTGLSQVLNQILNVLGRL